MYTKFDFIRRFFAKKANQVAHFIAFDMDVDIDVNEGDLLEDLEYRGFGASVAC